MKFYSCINVCEIQWLLEIRQLMCYLLHNLNDSSPIMDKLSKNKAKIALFDQFSRFLLPYSEWPLYVKTQKVDKILLCRLCG